jgi:transaldolase
MVKPDIEGRAIFVDRDGVLVVPEFRDGRSFAPRTLDTFQLYAGVADSARRLKEAGYKLVVVTNQPDVGNGLVDQKIVEEMHERLSDAVSVDAIEVCYHKNSDACDCRKPTPGMLLRAAERMGLDCRRSVMVGDRWSDVEAGRAVGCTTVFIDLNYSDDRSGNPDFVASSFNQAADIILSMPDQLQTRRELMSKLKIKIFADGADFDQIVQLAKNPQVTGFTTNPTLMRKAGISDYAGFARKVLAAIPDRPISFEVFADDLPTMIVQGREIASWGRNANVKIPVTNTESAFCGPVIKEFADAGIIVNVTAIMTPDQVKKVSACLNPKVPAIVSVFAGRIADTGRDPIPLMKECLDHLRHLPKAELLWASPRELLNVFQADEMGCHIITVTNDVLSKLSLVGKDLNEYSLDTVKMFRKDAVAAGYSIAAKHAAA